MFTSILSAIAAIPALIQSIQELLAYFKKAEEEKWFVNNAQVFQDLKKAQTEEEILNAAKAIQNSIRNL